MIVSFQAIDWVAKDVGPLYDASEFKRNEVAYGETPHDPCENLEIPKYNIKIFGRALNKDAISVNARDYTPHFYIKLPKELSDRQIDAFKDYINTQIPEKWLVDKDNDLYYYTKKSLHDVVATNRKDLWGFTNNKLFPFLRISFHNELIMRYVAKLFKKAVAIVGVFKKTTFALYESNIEPYLRFIHKQNIQPAGWIEIDKNTCEKNEKILPSKKGILDYNTNWKNVIGVDKNIIAPFIVASFDIECNSSHGDFPVPQKDYEKIAIELNTIYHKIISKNERVIKDILIESILSGFDNTIETDYKISKIYTKKPYDIEKFRIYLSNGLIDDIYVILKGKLLFQKDDKSKVDFSNYLRKSSICDEDSEELSEMDKFKNIFKQTKDVQNKISIIIKQLTDKLTAIFPDIEGDQVIQIGTTFHIYGEKECFYKNVITLDTCDDIDGVEVVSVDNEKDLIKAWIKVINKYDPDIITGYNILGFDFNFLYKRCLELRLKKQILKINRIKNHLSEWKVHTLSSSALGDNELKYVNPEGRVLIDIMKVVQRDHKLDSYKLDYVSGNFISGKITSIEVNDNTICCSLDSSNGIQIGSYVVIGENEKVEVKDVKGKNIYIEKKDNFDLTAIKWGLSKDDVTPKEIFECQKGTSTDRARVAKYCVMDCALCNYLMIKLETLANNIGMSNVCSIPLSYIFMRGQGIKIFSFVAKQCKEDDFLIPTLDKDWKCDFCNYKNSSYNDTCYKCTSAKPEDEGYEGAIVLHPKPGIYTNDPIAVLDYASLYPSSMISENISHDSIVLDSKYDNLPGFEYVDVTYDVYEGKGDKKVKVNEETCRYAQFKDNKKGVLPRILQKLLTQRKDTRKKIEEKKITLKDNTIIQGIISENSSDTLTIIKSSDKSKITINIEDIILKEDVYNEFEKAVLDGLQLAYKVTANSLYGQVGAKTSAIFLKELAASTTATGRNLILGAKKFVEDSFPKAEVIYGDSVPSDEPVVIRDINNGLIDVRAISDITNEWENYEDFKNSDYIVKIREILKLILIDGCETEEECIDLTKSIPKWLRCKTINDKTLVSVNNRWKWCNNINDSIETIEHIEKLFEKDTENRFNKQQSLVNYEIWTDNGWQKILRIIRHKTNKKIHRIATGLGSIDVTEDHSLCDSNKNPIKPNEVTIGTKLLHSAFNIDYNNLENKIPMVLEYPHKYWGETQQKFVDDSTEIYKCNSCQINYDGSMYYWIKSKEKNANIDNKVRQKQCKLCIKAKQCKLKGIEFNGKLNREIINVKKDAYILTSDEAWVWGFFLGDGSCGRYECKSGIKNTWALNNQNLDRLNHAKKTLETVEKMEFKILETMKSSGVYKLVPIGSFIYMVQKYRKLMYDNFDQKKVPKLILNAPYTIRKAFFDGYYEADGTKSVTINNNKVVYTTDENWVNTYNKVEITAKGKSTAQQLFILATSIGIKLKVLIRKDKPGIFRMGTYTKENREAITCNDIISDSEKNIENEYVYDIETVTGRFNCGVGNITILNTDSIFISFKVKERFNLSGKEAIKKAIELGKEASDGYQKHLKKPHVLEYEKTFYPFIIFSKKRYVGNLYEHDENNYKRKVMGLSLVRRDFANIQKIVYGGIIDIILKTNDIQKSIEYFHKCINDILEGNYPLEDFILTKTLKGQYKTPDRIVHKVLADRMAMRDKGSAPQVNDRVPFVYITKEQKKGQKMLQGERIEDPSYIRKNNLPIDYEFYITNQIQNSVTQLYSLIIEDLPEFKLEHDHFIKMENTLKLDKKNDKKKIELKIKTAKEKIVEGILFTPYINKLYPKKNNMRDITDFLILYK